MVATSVAVLPTAGLSLGLAAVTYVPIHLGLLTSDTKNKFGTIVTKGDKIYIFWDRLFNGIVIAGAIGPGAAKSLA